MPHSLSPFLEHFSLTLHRVFSENRNKTCSHLRKRMSVASGGTCLGVPSAVCATAGVPGLLAPLYESFPF